ncbi:MAG: hypothetical protein KKF44_07120 [Nanoarchaeota archaeon]|nr:hypothetical protein [Nanoarchaeota archaeon]
MATTIQVKDTTLQMLKDLKEKENAKTYDEVISNIVKEKMNVKESMFGTLKGKKFKWNKETDRLKFREY